MPSRRPHVAASATQSELATALVDLRHKLELPSEFPADVLAEADFASSALRLPELDLTTVEFVTIDPQGSTDLDQALHIERNGAGFRVRYAIADVPALVAPGGAVDDEARRRGQTLYAADGRIALHPPAIGDGAASLLPGQLRGAYVWDFDLDSHARQRAVTVQRARVRSRQQLTYEQAQGAIDDGSASETLNLLKAVGQCRIALERERGGASLNAPEEEIVMRDGAYTIQRRIPLAVEDWNAQISLMTGMAAAELMLAGGVGILRTMPPPSEDAAATFRTQTEALGRPWALDMPYGEYLRSLDHDDPVALAVLQAATTLFRGAGYTVFDGEHPNEMMQSAVAAPYAHTTAPLRRLVDRWCLVICEALSNETDVPGWARKSLPQLPAIMDASTRLSSELNAASLDRVEAALLSGRVGEAFSATVIAIRGDSARIQLRDPFVTASCPVTPGLASGATVRAKLQAVDIASGSITFELA
jgi:exoribonuclease R